jgi:putative MATE family efflux protein
MTIADEITMEPSDGPSRPATDLVDRARPTWQLVFLLGWPVLLQQSLIMAVGLYDSYLSGNNLPEDPEVHIAYQAGQTTANYLNWFLSSAVAVVSVGSTALVARLIGARENRDANRVANQSLLLAVLFGSIMSLVGLLMIGTVARWMGLEAPAIAGMREFLTPILCLFIFQAIELTGIACLVGAGDTRTGMFVLGSVAILNIPLATIFLKGFGPIPAMGFMGIGIGTALSHAIGGLAVMTILIRGRKGLQLQLSAMAPRPDLIRRILRISIPATIDTISLGLCQLWFLSLVNSLDSLDPKHPIFSTAHGIAIRWESLGYLSGYAFATAASALVGQNLGAKQPDQAAKAGWTAFGMGCCVMILMGCIFYALAPAMFKLFCPFPEQQPIIDQGVPVLRLVAFAMPQLACIIIFTGALRGAGDTRVPMVLTWIGFLLIRLPLAYILIFDEVDLGSLGKIPGFGLKLYGAWLAMYVDLLARGLLFLARFASGRWKRIKV